MRLISAPKPPVSAAKPLISGAKPLISGARVTWHIGGFRQFPEVFKFTWEFSVSTRCLHAELPR